MAQFENITKTGILSAQNELVEFGLSENLWQGINGYSSSNGIYTINSAVSTSGWGSGFSLKDHIFPYGTYYRVSMDVKVPSAHRIQIDINNKTPSTITAWSGNDNDIVGQRTGTSFNIPADVWTTITWGSINLNPNNTTHSDLYVYDNVGLITSGDSATVQWQMKNPKYQLGFITSATEGIFNKASFTKSGNIYANDFYEI